MFATLDPTLRRIKLPEFGAAILVDTVGFVRDLPHDLVEAFRATLEETKEAVLLLHVVDSNDPERRDKIEAVTKVLEEIGASAVPQLLVYNKIDLTPHHEPRIDADENEIPRQVFVSAVTGSGLELLLEAIATKLSGAVVEQEFILKPTEGRYRAKLYALGSVISEEIDNDGNCHLRIKVRRPS